MMIHNKMKNTKYHTDGKVTKYHTDGKVTKSKRKNHRNKGKMELNQLICHILHIVYLIVS